MSVNVKTENGLLQIAGNTLPAVDSELSELNQSVADLKNSNTNLAKSLANYNGKNLKSFYTPTEFKEKISNGDFTNLELGDYYEITLSGDEENTNHPWGDGETIKYVISGFNTYLNYGKNNILTNNHIIMTSVDCMFGTMKMNETDDNTGGYAASLMPTYLEKVFERFPEEWKNVIRPLDRLENNKSKADWATRNLFLLSETEINGYSIKADDYFERGTRPLPLYQFSSRYRIKGHGFNSSSNGIRAPYWTASPLKDSSIGFSIITYNGLVDFCDSSSDFVGVATGFCI
ncbi:hypothetical protein D7V86_03400 [bacterium D16-51]|nr:hypothetical protein D7V96_00520 [bacterium D16-59]RKI61854.1 hypothetical protein D7V86_03400 [bacterium D16-51]